MSNLVDITTALSIRQPWAWAIVNGYKDIENRSWNTNYRGFFLVHAPKTFDVDGYEWIKDNFDFDIPKRSQFETGGIVGVTNLIEVVTKHKSKWFEGPYGYLLEKSGTIPFFPLRGQLGFFEVNDISIKKLLNEVVIHSG